MDSTVDFSKKSTVLKRFSYGGTVDWTVDFLSRELNFFASRYARAGIRGDPIDPLGRFLGRFF